MSYRVRRIDPYWFNHPAIPVAIIAGSAIAAFGGYSDKPALAIPGVAISAIGIVLGTRPAITSTMFMLGFLGGLTTFVLFPGAQNAGLPLIQKIMSTAFYSLFYAILTAGALLLLSVVYNFFAALGTLGGLSLELEDAGGDQ
jgi:hypothetical protein